MEMTTAYVPERTPARAVAPALAPLMAVVFVAFLVIGAAMPVLPLYVRDGLGFGPFMVGLVSGCQFGASLVSRMGAGRATDRRGAKHAVLLGLSAASAAGLLYWFSLRFTAAPGISILILLAGRAVLGGAESFVITGATLWGLARVGPQNAGKVIAWIGTAMFAAFAAGAPLGTMLYARGGFAAIAIATTLAPLGAALVIAPLRAIAPEGGRPQNILSVARLIWLPGLGSALSTIGFGAVTAFISLLFVERGWSPVWLAFTAYAVALIVARLLFGHLPDKIGGAKVALVSLAIEAAGLALVWLAWSGASAAAGAGLTGLGYALVYPSFGAEAVSRTSRENRGLAMGAFTAFMDLALGIAGPALGAVASLAGLGAVFLASAIIVLGAAAVALSLLRRPAR
jgi:MFS family permease